MAIKTPIEEKKRQQKLLIVLVVIILITLIVLYFGVWSKKSNSVVVDSNTLPQEVTNIDTSNSGSSIQVVKRQLSSIELEEKLKRVSLNVDFLSKTILPLLRIYGDLPVKKGVTGRLNPFAPQ